MKLFARFISAALLVLGVLSLGIAAEAQTSTTGIVLGTVTDTSGATIVDAAVVLRNTATNNQTTQNTNNAGEYTFVNVAPGTYEVTVKEEGFRASTVTALTVEVAKSYTVDVKLEIGAVSESITVSTEARSNSRLRTLRWATLSVERRFRGYRR